MREVILKKLTLSKFRCHKELVMEFNSEMNTIVGDNEAGKSTLETAFNFLLLGKNQHGMSELKFFKPMRGDQVVYPKDGYSVKAEFEVKDSKMPSYIVSLERKLSQTFTKRRGAETEEFTGHTNDYYVSGIIVTLGDFNNEVAKLIGYDSSSELFKTFSLEEVISLCMNINYFPAQLNGNMNRQREILFSVIPPISDADIFNELNLPAESLTKLQEFISDRNGLVQQKKMFSSKINELKKEEVKIIPQIEALENLKKDVEGLDRVQIEADIIVNNKKIDKLNQSITSSREPSVLEKLKAEQKNNVAIAIAELELKLNEELKNNTKKWNDSINVNTTSITEMEGTLAITEGQIVVSENNLKSGLENSKAIIKKDIENLEARLVSSKGMLDNYKSNIDELNNSISKTTKDIDELRSIGQIIINREYVEHEHEKECPTCKRAFTDDDIILSAEAALKHFNDQQEIEIAEINKKGVNLRERNIGNAKALSEMTIKFNNNKVEISELEGKINALHEKETKVDSDIAKLELLLKDPLKAESGDFEELKRLTIKRDELVFNISELNCDNSMLTSLIEDAKLECSSNKELVSLKGKQKDLELFKDTDAETLFDKEKEKIEVEVAKIRLVIAELQDKDSMFKNNDSIKIEIAKYEEKHKELNAEIAKYENQVMLIEKYNTSKLSILDKELSKVFNYVSFQLYELQSNGELKDVCNVVVNGRHYHKELNLAAKINAGIEIVNAMQNHFGISLPIFVDNSESIKDIHKTNGQLIALKFIANQKLKNLN